MAVNGRMSGKSLKWQEMFGTYGNALKWHDMA